MLEPGSTPLIPSSRHPLQLNPQNRTTLITFMIILVTTLIVVLQMIKPYFLTLTLGLLLALLTYGLYQKLRISGIRPKLASFLITLGVTLLIVGPVVIFSILAVRQGITIAEKVGNNGGIHFSLPTFLEKMNDWEPVRALIGDASALETQARGWFQELVRKVTPAVLGFAADIPLVLLQAFLAIISCFFFLLDGKRLFYWLSDKIPLDYEVRESLIHSVQNTAISVIWATLAAAGVQSFVMLIAFLVLGVPAAFLAAGATFIFAWIPMVGSFPVWITGALYLYGQHSILKAVLMIAFGVFTSVIDNFIRPWVLKGQGQMHPLVSLVAIFGGIGMFGILGVFMGPILAALAIAMLQVWPTVGRRFGLIPESMESTGLIKSS